MSDTNEKELKAAANFTFSNYGINVRNSKTSIQEERRIGQEEHMSMKRMGKGKAINLLKNKQDISFINIICSTWHNHSDGSVFHMSTGKLYII